MKPILFNTDMVRAILEGRKTVTRRVLKMQPLAPVNTLYRIEETNIWRTHGTDCWYEFRAPCVPGDILWVRETFIKKPNGEYLYKADDETVFPFLGWRPSIHMPREAARIFLRVTGVQVERLQDINGLHAKEEGCEGYVHINPLYGCPETVHNFKALWDSTLKPADRPVYGWDANPWVWVIEFERISKEEAERHG